VVCTDKNDEVSTACDILFLCILPSQLPSLVFDLKGNIRKDSLVYSFIPTYSVAKISSLLAAVNVVHPKYHCNQGKQWDYTTDITAIFKNEALIEQMCPLSFNFKGEDEKCPFK
jgi:hypothetical protein